MILQPTTIGCSSMLRSMKSNKLIVNHSKNKFCEFVFTKLRINETFKLLQLSLKLFKLNILLRRSDTYTEIDIDI